MLNNVQPNHTGNYSCTANTTNQDLPAIVRLEVLGMALWIAHI